jgi:transposase
MIAALIEGVTEPDRLADLARRRLRVKIPQLRRALHGQVTEHHRFMLRTLMDHVHHLDDLITRLEQRIEGVMCPFDQAAERLMSIPGINRRAAEVIVAEIGVDLSRFPSAGHLGSRWLRQVLVQVAWAASHTKRTSLAATYHRWVKRMGKKRALVALGHKILIIIYELLKDQTTYTEQSALDNAA